MTLGYTEGCPTVCSRSSRLFVERIESFQHRVESITLGTHDVHPDAQSGEAGLGDAIHRPGRSRGCRFFPRVEKSVALEVTQGPVDTRSVDGSEAKSQRRVDKPVAVARFLGQKEENRWVDKMTGRCNDEPTPSQGLHMWGVPTVTRFETPTP
jgi:hypothetical protein